MKDRLSPFPELPTVFYTDDQLRTVIEFLASGHALMAADFPSGPVNMPFRARSRPLAVTFASKNPFGAASGPARLVADGFWVLLRPLKPGTTHTITIRGRVPGGFTTNVTYKLRVGPAAGIR